jgi:hypothetical protein
MISDRMATKLDQFLDPQSSTGRLVYLSPRGHFLGLKSISLWIVHQDCRKSFEVY